MVLIAAVFWLLSLGPATAQEGYENSCDPTKLMECHDLAALYYTGKYASIPKDKKRAIALFQTAYDTATENCEAGDLAFCSLIIVIAWENPLEVPNDEKVALMSKLVEKLRAACDDEKLEACVELLGTDALRTADTDALVEQSLEACLDEQHRACEGLTRHYIYYISIGVVDWRSDEVFLRHIGALTASCNRKSALACRTVASMSLVTSKETAFRELACDYGSQVACTNRGIILFHEYLTTGDKLKRQQAVELWTSACEQGNAIACHAVEHVSEA